jgi:perosamine synthetase
MAKLAINGGKPIRTELYKAYNTIGEAEKNAVMKVLNKGNLSQFLGGWHKDFFGGPTVQEFERAWSDVFNVAHSITVNSNTSGLFTAIAACGIKPGDEVIVSPYSMSASAIAPLIYGAVPVFADIDPENFGLSPESIESKITNRTRAIIVVHIFGNPAKMDEIMSIAKQHNLFVIEDCAQAPLSTYKNKLVGTIGDIGVFSLNYHKHIHTGEGGVLITNNEVLSQKIQLIRNHAENSVHALGFQNEMNLFGFNYRMTEIEAAIGIEQLKKLPQLVNERISNANYFAEKISQIDGIEAPSIEPFSKHVYYKQPFKFDKNIIGVHRNKFIEAVKAEIPSAVLREDTPLIESGYVKPLYLLPIFQNRTAHCAFNCSKYEGEVNYSIGSCPNVEKLHFEELFSHEYMRPGMSINDMNEVISAFYKVIENIEELY